MDSGKRKEMERARVAHLKTRDRPPIVDAEKRKGPGARITLPERLRKPKANPKQDSRPAETKTGTNSRGPRHQAPMMPPRIKGNLVTVFAKEDRAEVEHRKLLSRRPLQRWQICVGSETELHALPLPVRPPWTFGEPAAQLEMREQRYFEGWLKTIYANCGMADLNIFEHNLEVWRQLWRVVERSDLIVIVADARNPLVHFSAALYDLCVRRMQRPLVLVLSKVRRFSIFLHLSWTRPRCLIGRSRAPSHVGGVDAVAACALPRAGRRPIQLLSASRDRHFRPQPARQAPPRVEAG
jgi:hypothetical protein